MLNLICFSHSKGVNGCLQQQCVSVWLCGKPQAHFSSILPGEVRMQCYEKSDDYAWCLHVHVNAMYQTITLTLELETCSSTPLFVLCTSMVSNHLVQLRLGLPKFGDKFL